MQNYISLIILVYLVFAFELLHLYLARSNKDSPILENSYMVILGFYASIVIILFILHYLRFLNKKVYFETLLTAISLFVLSFISNLYFYDVDISIIFIDDENLLRKKKKSAMALTLVLFTIVTAFSIKNIVSASLFGTDSSWFSDTMDYIVAQENMDAMLTIMFFGFLTIVIAKVNKSASIGYAGYFLILGLPLLDIIQFFMSESSRNDIKNTPLFNVFEDLWLAIFVYIVILLAFYVLLLSIFYIIMSMIEGID